MSHRRFGEVVRVEDKPTQPYCGWTASIRTSWDGGSPLNCGINHLPTGAGFCQSTGGADVSFHPLDLVPWDGAKEYQVWRLRYLRPEKGGVSIICGPIFGRIPKQPC